MSYKNDIVLIGDSNTVRLGEIAQGEDGLIFMGIKGANLFRNYNEISKLSKNVPDNADVVLYFGNEVDTAANDYKVTNILMGRDHLSSKLYNGLLTKNKIRPNDPLLILNYYHGKLLRVCKDTLARYVLCLRRFISELPHINQASIILMGPRAKKIEYHNILVNLITYYINMELKKMIANDPGQISSNVVIKYIDFFSRTSQQEFGIT